jgi:hypothetical protein
MSNKFLFWFGIILIVLTVLYLALNAYNRYMSPSGETMASIRDFSVKVEYSSPSVRGRVIFGENEEEALLPYGEYWRLGANEPTRITVSHDFTFDGTPLEAGQYDMYAFPRKDKMELRLNEDNRAWGMTEPDYDEEVAKTLIDLKGGQKHTEEFTINAEASGDQILLHFLWSEWKWTVPIEKQ